MVVSRAMRRRCVSLSFRRGMRLSQIAPQRSAALSGNISGGSSRPRRAASRRMSDTGSRAATTDVWVMVCTSPGEVGSRAGKRMKRQRARTMYGAPGAGSAQAVGVVPGVAAATGLAAAIDAAPGLLTPGVHIGGPQGLAIDSRYATLPTALYYGGYVRQGRLSDKGFHKFEPLVGFNHFDREFLSFASPPTRNPPSNFS